MGEIIVAFEDDSSALDEEFRACAHRMGAVWTDEAPGDGRSNVLFRHPLCLSTDQALSRMRACPGVAHTTRNVLIPIN